MILRNYAAGTVLLHLMQGLSRVLVGRITIFDIPACGCTRMVQTLLLKVVQLTTYFYLLVL